MITKTRKPIIKYRIVGSDFSGSGLSDSGSSVLSIGVVIGFNGQLADKNSHKLIYNWIEIKTYRIKSKTYG